MTAAAAAQTPAQPTAPTQATAQTANQKPTTTDQEDTARRRFWQASLPGGQYMVALDRITSISRHSYTIVEAAALVDEVVVDTVGQTVVRFYFVQPLTEGVNNNAASHLTQRAKELMDYGGQRAGTDAHKSVVKKYPEGTYARTVEYRVNSATELGALFGSVRSAWETGRGRIFAVK
jgi:hypothetical protein